MSMSLGKQKLSEEEINELGPYCQCKFHRQSVFNPKRYLYPLRQIGCLYSSKIFPIEIETIERTREYKKKMEEKNGREK